MLLYELYQHMLLNDWSQTTLLDNYSCFYCMHWTCTHICNGNSWVKALHIAIKISILSKSTAYCNNMIDLDQKLLSAHAMTWIILYLHMLLNDWSQTTLLDNYSCFYCMHWTCKHICNSNSWVKALHIAIIWSI